MSVSGLVGRVLGFLRAGYPDGVPATDYVPLFALLRRRLSDDEVRAVAREMTASGVLPVNVVDIEVAITKAREFPIEEANMRRIAHGQDV